MPLYLYICDKCQTEQEVIQGLNAASPLCCGDSMRKLPTMPSKIEIKGIHSAGYKRDYAKDYRRRHDDYVDKHRKS
jgi:putative FmdB family regulatory protein